MLEKVGVLAYRVTLPPKLGKIHNVFHLSLLRKYVYDVSHVVQIEPIQLNENLAYEEYPIQIIDIRDGNGAGLGRAPLSHTRPKIFNYFPSPSQTRNGAGFSFPSPIRMPLKIPYPLHPAPPKFKFKFGFGFGFGFGFLIPYTFQISQKLFSE